jgi:hypothetical protein
VIASTPTLLRAAPCFISRYFVAAAEVMINEIDQKLESTGAFKCSLSTSHPSEPLSLFLSALI